MADKTGELQVRVWCKKVLLPSPSLGESDVPRLADSLAPAPLPPHVRDGFHVTVLPFWGEVAVMPRDGSATQGGCLNETTVLMLTGEGVAEVREESLSRLAPSTAPLSVGLPHGVPELPLPAALCRRVSVVHLGAGAGASNWGHPHAKCALTLVLSHPETWDTLNFLSLCGLTLTYYKFLINKI